MQYVLLSISGKDRSGIVRDVAEALLNIQANIEDSSMTALRGRFTMMLIVNLAEDCALSALKAVLAELEQRTGLTVQSQLLPEADAKVVPQAPDCVITVAGADKPGIVHAVTKVLADAAISIVDVSTQSRENEQGNLYMMALEVVVGAKTNVISKSLETVSSELGVEIQLHELESEVL